ncbi:hypothetical protein SRHO_G00050540 [Serrasalmus rhombeus]
MATAQWKKSLVTIDSGHRANSKQFFYLWKKDEHASESQSLSSSDSRSHRGVSGKDLLHSFLQSWWTPPIGFSPLNSTVRLRSLLSSNSFLPVPSVSGLDNDKSINKALWGRPVRESVHSLHNVGGWRDNRKQSVGTHSSEGFSLSGLSGPSYQEAPLAQRWVAVCPDAPRGCLQPQGLTAAKAKEG